MVALYIWTLENHDITCNSSIHKVSEMLFVRFHRKLNFWATFVFLQYFTHFGEQKN